MMIWFLPLFGFLLGSIPFGLIAGKLRGIDIRQQGSGNIGATNVFRVLGKKAGISCLVLDFLKGLIPVLIAQQITVPLQETNLGTAQAIVVLTGFAAIMGHNFCPWIGFKGGKGIATTGGALAGLMPVGTVLLLAIWALFTFTTKYVSVGSIAAAIALPFLSLWGSYYHGKFEDGTWNKSLFVFCLVAGAMAVYKHRTNIARLRSGTEHRIGSKKKES